MRIPCPRPATPLRYRRGAEHLCRLGPRAAAEFLAEIADAHGPESDVLRRLDDWRRITPAMIRTAGADHLPPLLAEVER